MAGITGESRRLRLVLAGVAGAVVVAGGVAWAVWPSPDHPGSLAGPSPSGAATGTPSAPAATRAATPQPTEQPVGLHEVDDLPPPRPPVVVNPPPGVTVPAPPSDLYVSRKAGTHDYHFEWVDNSDNESGFTVYFNDGHQANVVDHRYWYERANLPPQTEICFTVDAYNAAGHSAAPPWRCVTTPPPAPTSAPAAPSGLTATADPAGDAAVDLRWTDNSDNEEFFYVQARRAGVSQGERQVPANATGARWSVDRGVTYCFMVRAYNIVGSSSWSSEACVWLEPLPAAPSGLTTAIVGTTVHLTWTDNATNEAGFTITLVSNGSLAARKVPADSTAYDWTDLPVDTRLCFSIRAFNAVGSSGPASAACLTIPAG